MLFSWEYQENTPQQVKVFLKKKGVSRGLLAKVKFQGGEIKVNEVEENALYELQKGDCVTIRIPDEGEHETLLTDSTPIDIIFEDEHLLVVNKPANVASIPAQFHPNGTMANRVKNYYCQQNYVDRVVHVVTRLDRDTTGLMIFAKHGFAHAMLDKQLREKKLIKKYQALVGNDTGKLQTHDWIDYPIIRDTSSILKRKTGEEGLAADTEYWLVKEYKEFSLVEIQLHTGRTHQIRVHFEAIECPLLGDELYNGKMTCGIHRQALHCSELSFRHPFTDEPLHFNLELPDDMQAVINSTK